MPKADIALRLAAAKITLDPNQFLNQMFPKFIDLEASEGMCQSVPVEWNDGHIFSSFWRDIV